MKPINQVNSLKIHSRFQLALQEKGMPYPPKIDIENFFSHEGKLYCYDSYSSSHILPVQLNQDYMLGLSPEDVVTVHQIMTTILRSYVPRRFHRFSRILQMFLLTQRKSYRELPLLREENYFYSTLRNVILYKKSNGAIVPFSWQNLNAELAHYGLPATDKKTFHRLSNALLHFRKQLNTEFSVGLKETLSTHCHTLQLYYRSTERMQIPGSPKQAIETALSKNELASVIYKSNAEFFNLFHKNLEKHMLSQSPITKEAEAILYEACCHLYNERYEALNIETKREPEFQGTLIQNLLSVYLGFAKELLVRCDIPSFAEPNYNIVSDIQKKLLKEFTNESIGAFYRFCKLLSDIKRNATLAPKLHVLVYSNDSDKTILRQLLDTIFRPQVKEKYSFRNLPYGAEHMYQMQMEGCPLILLESVTATTQKEPVLDRLFHGKLIQKSKIMFLNNLHFVCFTKSLSLAKRLENMYGADIVEVTDANWQECPLTILSLRHLVDYGTVLNDTDTLNEPLVETFLKKYTVKDSDCFVLAAMLIDAIKLYLSNRSPKNNIKDFVTPICNYIGSKKCYSRKAFSQEELEQLPKKYRASLNKSKRKNARRFLGLSFDYKAFCEDFNIG